MCGMVSRLRRFPSNGTGRRPYSAWYLFLIVGTPLVAFLIAASSAFEAHGVKLPLVRIGTGMAGLILQATPFMLLGALMSAAVATFVSPGFLARHVPRSSFGGFALALAAGVCMPVCDCMVVPTFSNLVRKRLPLPYAVTFLAAVPVMNPMAMWSTWYAFPDRPWMVACRVGLGMTVAASVGLTFMFHPMRTDAVAGTPHAAGRACPAPNADMPRGRAPVSRMPGEAATSGAPVAEGSGTSSLRSPLARFIRHTQSDFLRMMPILLFGAFAASVTRIALSNGGNRYGASGLSGLVAIAAAMALAFLCSLCSSSDAVIAASLAGVLPLPALLAFLVFGPVLDLKNALMLATECRWRFALRFALTFALVCLAVMALTGLAAGAFQ